MPQNWKTYKLGEVIELKKNSIRPDQFNGQPYLGLEHITQGTFLLDGIGNSSDVTSNKYRFEPSDILYGKIRPYFKKAYQPDFSGICSTDILVIQSRNTELFDQNYLYHVVKTQWFTDKAVETSSGTKMPRADWNSIKSVECDFPEIEEQKAIASILSAIDDKIENNLAMNKTLEEMAEELFTEWFVEKAKEEWGTVRLQDLIEIKGGFSYKGKFIGFGNSLLLGMGCVSFGKRFLQSGARQYSGECGINHLVKPGDLVIATRQQSDNMPILGYPAKIPISLEGEKVIVGTNLYRVFNNSYFSNDLLFQLLRSSTYRNHILANAKGSTVRMITKDAIELFEFKIPPEELLKQYDKILAGLGGQIEFNNLENQTLTELRDTLLPKLISGEVRVKDVEKTVANAL